MSLPQFELTPSVGLSEIKLGTKLYTILRQLSHLHLQVAFRDSKTLPSEPITVTIKKYAIRMTFEPSKQLLIFIELLDLKKIDVSYNGKMIREKGFKTLYDYYMGPTYPGELQDECYILSYPGLSFRFAMPDDVSRAGGDKTLEELLEKNPRAQSVVVHQLPKWSGVFDGGIAYSKLVKEVCTDEIVVDKFVIVQQVSIEMLFSKHPSLKHLYLVLNETCQQDILQALGPPDEVFNKNDSRTLIHNSEKDEKTTASVFHNYFRFGFDLLYNTTRTGAVLSKIVMHSNVPTNVMFGKYAKCQWVYKYLSGGSEYTSNSTMDFSKLTARATGKPVPPVLINRNEMLSSSIEILGDGPGNGDKNEIKWGMSKVYAFDREIWEMVDDGFVNSLTLY